mmetsp:Transcript_62146/g.173620  ORF Transcript_62146/g.173620 Transcript_62146/m.173620 type:complete len:347 (-) Transcript_62146:385-1425(-)
MRKIIGRMCRYHAGTTMPANPIDNSILVQCAGSTWTVIEISATATSNAFSHATPIRIPMALIMARIASSMLSSTCLKSWTISKQKIMIKAMIVTHSACVTCFVIPCCSPNIAAARYQSVPKNRDHAKVMPMTFFVWRVSLGIDFLMKSTRSASKSASTAPTATRWPASSRVCPASTGPGSSPSSFGSVPPRAKRVAWMKQNDTARPTTSSSVSSVSSSHIASCSCFSLSPISATRSLTASVARPVMKITTHGKGAIMNACTGVVAICTCSTAKAWMAAKPVMWPRRMAKVFNLASMTSRSSNLGLKPFSGSTPVMTASKICRQRNQMNMWTMTTINSVRSEAPSKM